jgi:hypothetical protein
MYKIADCPDRTMINSAVQNEEKKTFTGAELYTLNSEKIPCLIEPIMPVVGVVALVCGSDTGKSMLLRQLAISVVSETSFLGFSINAVHRKVIFKGQTSPGNNG